MRRALTFLILAGPLANPALPAQPEDLAESYYHFSLAKMYEGERQFQAAVEEYEKALALDPESSQLRFEFGRALIQASEIRRGVQELEKSIELDPENFRPHLLLGQVRRRYVETGDGSMLDKAIASFRRVLELEENHPEALYYLGELLLLKGDPEAAAAALDQFNRVRPGVGQAALLEARARLALEDIEGAVAVLEECLKFDQEEPEVLELLGRLYEQQGEDGKALEVFQKALRDAPTLEIRFRTGALLSRVGRHDEAIELLEEVATEAPDRPPIQLELAKAYSERRDFGKAAELFSRILEQEPDHREANYYLAVALRALGKREEAIERIRHLLSLAEGEGGPESDGDYQHRLKSFLAVLYQEDRQFERSVSLFRELTEADPESFRWQLGLIYALKEKGDLEAALRRSGDLLRQYPDDLDVQVTHAQILSESGRLEAAVGMLEDQISRDPLEENYYLAAGQLFSDHKQFSEAERVLRRGLQVLPESERLNFQIAAMQERQGKIDLAEAGFRRILESNPEHAPVLNYLGYMLADRGVRLEEALSYIEKAIELDPYNGAYLDSLGWVYYQLDRLDQAESKLTQAAEINDSDPTIFEHLGDLYLKLGDYSKARVHYRQSLQFAEDQTERAKVEEKLDSVNRLIVRQQDN